jgi:hypothetical protein
MTSVAKEKAPPLVILSESEESIGRAERIHNHAPLRAGLKPAPTSPCFFRHSEGGRQAAALQSMILLSTANSLD